MTNNSPLLICTVYNRGEELLTPMVKSLMRQTNKNFRILFVDDGSTDGALESVLKETCAENVLRITTIRVDTQKDRPHCMVSPRGDNNPAYAFNRGIAWALENNYEHIGFFSSDVVFNSTVMRDMEQYLPRLEDLCVHGRAYEQGNHGYSKDGSFCSSSLIRPLGWLFMTHSTVLERAKLQTMNDQWFDESYLGGFAYEDGDFTGRVAIAAGKMVSDDMLLVRHQHHTTDQPGEGHRNNARYARNVWGHPEPWDAGKIRRKDLVVNGHRREFLVLE